MMIKAIVTDLDQTLLHTDKSLSDYAAGIFRRCSQKGFPIIFASGRPRRDMLPYAKRIPVQGMVCHNGATAFMGEKRIGQFGIQKPLRDALLFTLLEQSPDWCLAAEIDDILFANFDANTHWSFTKFTWSDFYDLPDDPAEKILALLNAEEDRGRIEALLPEQLYILTTDQGTLGMVMHKEATKANGLLCLFDHLGIDPSEVVAFGDDSNDRDMLTLCGTAIAVENALDGIKTLADDICPCNDQDGVAQWLESHLL